MKTMNINFKKVLCISLMVMGLRLLMRISSFVFIQVIWQRLILTAPELQKPVPGF
jgi:hypothetical protein